MGIERFYRVGCPSPSPSLSPSPSPTQTFQTQGMELGRKLELY